MKLRFVTSALSGIVLLGSSFVTAQTTAPEFVQYSAKFLCGTVAATTTAPGPVAPGTYFTSINIHNPHENFFWPEPAITFLKKVVLSSPEGSTLVPPTAFVSDTLRNDFAEYVDCRIIRGMLGAAAPPAPAFIEGWVVLVAPPTHFTQALDVVGVYTDAAGALELKKAEERFFPPTPTPTPVPNPQPVNPSGI